MPERPDVTLQNYQTVYDYYGNPNYIRRYEGRRRLPTWYAHRLVDLILAPRLTYATGAKGAVANMVAQSTPALVLMNHVSNRDPNTAQSALHQDPSFTSLMRRDRLWTVAKDSLFHNPHTRTYMDSRNLIPAFRSKNYEGSSRLLLDASNRLNSVLVTHLQMGNSVAIFPEGERNTGNPLQVKRIAPFVARTVMGARERGASEVGLVCIGIHYGPDNRSRNASVHMAHYAEDVLPDKLGELRDFMQDGMQAAVDGAVANYEAPA